MYGIINNAIADLVTTGYGAPAWDSILDRAGLSTVSYELTRNYSDDETLRLVNAASAELGIPVDTVLETFGRWWVGYAERVYGSLLQLTGPNFASCLAKLDDLHARIKMAFPESQPPSFQSIPYPDGRIELHYRSVRSGLEPIVSGILHGLAERMGITLAMHWTSDPVDGHAIFEIVPSGIGTWPERTPSDDGGA